MGQAAEAVKAVGHQAAGILVTRTSGVMTARNSVMSPGTVKRIRRNHPVMKTTSNNKARVCHPDGVSCPRTSGPVVTSSLLRRTSHTQEKASRCHGAPSVQVRTLLLRKVVGLATRQPITMKARLENRRATVEIQAIQVATMSMQQQLRPCRASMKNS